MSVTVNGITYEGNNIKVSNNRVWVDGKEVKDSSPNSKGILKVEVTGTLHNLQSDASVVADDVDGDITAGGSVTCDDVRGNIKAGGSVTCDEVGGNVQSGGSVTCDDIGGSVMANGSVYNG